MRRYDGNTGKYIHIPDPDEEELPQHQESPQQQEPTQQYASPSPMMGNQTKPLPRSFGSGLQNMLSNIFAQGFETEDLLLFAILFLLYQETKDKEILIIMGGMFLL